MFKAILLDFDGTLVDTIEAHIISLIKALEDFKIKVEKEDVTDKIGMSFKDIIEKLKTKYPEISEIDINEIRKLKRKYFIENIDRVKLNRGAKELLNLLKERNIKVALTSSSNRDYIDLILSRFELRNYFDAIITADDVEKAKPDPDLYIKALEILNIKSYEALVIDDSIYGIVAAKRLGLPVFAVLTGVNTKNELKKFHPNGIFKDLYEIYVYLKDKL